MSSESFSLQSSLLMWALAALIVWMAAHVMLGWMRQAQEEWEWDWGRMRQVLLGSATFATALSVAIPLGLAGEALNYPLGYKPLWALGLWLGAVLAVTLLAVVPVWREEGASAASAGLLLGLLVTGLQVAWMLAAGFRPGIQWNLAFVGAAGLVSAAGTGTAMALAFPYGERARRYRYSWRIAAAGLIGLSFLAGYALVLYAADLPTQIGSAFRYELPGNMISLIGGGLSPIVLLLMVMDLETRRRQRRRQWRSRRRGEPSSYGADSTSMDMQPSRFLMQGPGTGAPDPESVPPKAAPPAPSAATENDRH
jgi:NO-binding membrane sensor protein with MHYT domain